MRQPGEQAISSSGANAWRESLAYQPVLLGGFTLIAGALLTYAYNVTKGDIAASEERDMQQTLAQVLPQGYGDNDLLKDVIELPGPGDGGRRKIYLVKKGEATVGAVFEVSEPGYAKKIALLMAVDKDGTVLGVRVVKHSETPGLGDKIEIGKHPWITSFDGKSLINPPPAKWAVKKDGGIYDAFAGATITPRAVVKAVKGGLEYFATHRAEILGGKS